MTSWISRSARCGSSSVAVTTATTAFVRPPQALSTSEYNRARFGIGRPPGRMDAATFVLRDFSAAERKELPLLIDRCADAVETLLSKGLAVAQNTFHAD